MDKVQSLIVYLFVTGEPVSHAALSKYFDLTREECMDAIAEADAKLAPLGLSIIDDGKEVELRTSPQSIELVEKIHKDEYSRDIGKAGIETLAIILYKGSASRSEIDYIRGVNSSHILRSLAMRGLLRRIPHPKDERSFLYEPTTNLFAHLGITKKEELPEYGNVIAEMTALERSAAEIESELPDDHAA